MKAIFFDLDGTLLHYTRNYSDILADAIREVEGEIRDGWIDSYNAAFFDILRDCEPNPFRQAFATFGDDPEALVDALREQEMKACQPPKNAQTDLAKLAGEYKLGVLTNGVSEWQKYKLRAYDLDTYFDTVVTSYDAGAPKPEVAPFHLAEKRLPADDYAMIGDDDADIDGAQNAGWIAYRYSGQGFGGFSSALQWE
jgi:putative hydrolase of the HAD superfamily